jgi:hypothetical protein
MKDVFDKLFIVLETVKERIGKVEDGSKQNYQTEL